jgi:hypothetical protein
MPVLTLSMGIRLLSQHVQRVEYHPCGSFRNSALLNGLMAGHVGVSARHEQHFLCICTTFGRVHVRGNHAAQDVTVLEQAGVQVYRSPLGDS